MNHRNATAAVMIDVAEHASFCATAAGTDPHVCAPEFAPDYIVDAHTLGRDNDGNFFLRQDEQGNERIPGLYGVVPVFDLATGRASVNLHTIGDEHRNLQALFTPAAARALAAQLLAAADAAEAAAR